MKRQIVIHSDYGRGTQTFSDFLHAIKESVAGGFYITQQTFVPFTDGSYNGNWVIIADTQEKS